MCVYTLYIFCILNIYSLVGYIMFHVLFLHNDVARFCDLDNLRMRQHYINVEHDYQCFWKDVESEVLTHTY